MSTQNDNNANSDDRAAVADSIETSEAPYGYKADGTPRKQRGRPKKGEIQAKKEGSRGKVGRPAGDAAAIKEMKARLLASPKSRKVLDSILNAALDDEHKNQAAAWKLLMDRMLPVGYFEKDKESGRAAVNITISGVGGDAISIGSNESPPQDDIDYSDYEVKDVN
jgi:hypothetical protein